MKANRDKLDLTVAEAIGGGEDFSAAVRVADAMEVSVESLRTMNVRQLSSDQIRAMCVTLHRSADEILGLDCGSESVIPSWLRLVDRADTKADQLECMGVLLESDNSGGYPDSVRSGVASLAVEGAEMIRELMAQVQALAAPTARK